ncbi:unnamed protein product (macronuclear) [Paramecium tetraurelia]|uniref:J domain-containing protein n=1 Tax=Paramecium tetraurelia TaxID=5888 RepID=A0DLU9_PARTE|nr:uncharacterized protein GSPATT00039648001 [Paramecium tetraurelia]CAK84016.1 unnamed protein product [Paramecium tetraurelia]|eukprot:XP_001451413.1 hypothetical protein (macronuclear) [Paramecium tetraurelia strain d4-2]
MQLVDNTSQEDAREKFAQIHEAYNILKQKKFYEQIDEEFKKNYYQGQSEEECFKRVFGFYFYEKPQEYYKPENAQKRADYYELLRKFKNQQQNTQEMQNSGFHDVKINRTFNSDSIYRYSDHTLLKVLIMFTLVVSITSAYVFFYKRQTTYAKNTITDSQIVRMRALAQLREQRQAKEKQE